MKNVFVPFMCVVVVSVSLSGCISVGPDYEQPETPVPDAWNEAVQNEFKSGDPDLQTWWTVLGDDTLNGLISRASTNNLDLKTAAARIEEAAALRGVSASQYFPEIAGVGGATAFRTTKDQTASGSNRTDELYQAGLTMAWELDLWGRVRRSVESADASLQATVENYRDIMVVLYADIAAKYINVRTLQERIALAENNLKLQRGTLKYTRDRFDAGLVPALDVAQAELNTARTESSIPTLKQQLIEAINRLSVLVGEMPYALMQTLEEVKPVPRASGEFMVGLPAELLRQRPDIRRSERELAAQNARIGATKAELYPTLTLPGSLTLESYTSGNVFSSGNTAYAFGPQVRLNIFNGKRIRSQINAEEAATKAALHAYEQTVLLALEEVEDTMSAYANELDRIKSLTSAAASAQKSVDLVAELYKSGLTDFQNVLNMEQAQLIQQDALATSKGLVSAYLVGVYKALGGGWKPESGE
ncbi:efflux transporter outer membrane subunit [Pontiella sulfatireligans]|uniref:Toluene efflux pump outer membrane protein TtgF n=1 Tax=Pontiella sulfatireligans TaxID=2750658 RepID=A0A6C2ULL5_9BACT|nr:efflux transporter outer membrane subunit [Pontiella sulfatireligans]VGO21145.1 Toluene efflux pump outer membrane protein TtgF [Pontiella sulfatireligans]